MKTTTIKIIEVARMSTKYIIIYAIDKQGNTYIITNVNKNSRYQLNQYWKVNTADIHRCKADKKTNFYIEDTNINTPLKIVNINGSTHLIEDYFYIKDNMIYNFCKINKNINKDNKEKELQAIKLIKERICA